MSITSILAAICIVLGILVGADAFKFWFTPLEWFVLAIALEHLGVTYTIGGRRGQ